jgi:hypothetical protein
MFKAEPIVALKRPNVFQAKQPVLDVHPSAGLAEASLEGLVAHLRRHN